MTSEQLNAKHEKLGRSPARFQSIVFTSASALDIAIRKNSVEFMRELLNFEEVGQNSEDAPQRGALHRPPPRPIALCPSPLLTPLV